MKCNDRDLRALRSKQQWSSLYHVSTVRDLESQDRLIYQQTLRLERLRFGLSRYLEEFFDRIFFDFSSLHSHTEQNRRL
jgi:hypothetical protein